MRLILLIIVALLFSCSTSHERTKSASSKVRSAQTTQKYLPVITQAEQQAAPTAQKVLAMARKMTLEDKVILPGGCWDYVDTVFTRAGFPRKVRKHVFNGKYPKGPFVNKDNIKVGDWLYFVNHSYHDIEHSSLFVGWVDKAKNRGLMLSYAGENRKEPARYRVYDLSHVYKIVRVE